MTILRGQRSTVLSAPTERGDKLSYGRTRKQAKLDEEKTFDDIIKQGPSETAKWHMQRKAYTTCSHRKERKQLAEYSSVADFYEARLKGGGAGGQVKTEKYIPNKARLKRIDARIEELCETEPAGEVMGKVRGSSKDFPYTEVRTSVMIPDPDEQERINKQIRKKEEERLQVLAEIQEVEEFLDGIGDVEIKEIFELLYVDVKKQREVADIIGYSRGRISQITSEYLKD